MRGYGQIVAPNQNSKVYQILQNSPFYSIQSITLQTETNSAKI